MDLRTVTKLMVSDAADLPLQRTSKLCLCRYLIDRNRSDSTPSQVLYGSIISILIIICVVILISMENLLNDNDSIISRATV